MLKYQCNRVAGLFLWGAGGAQCSWKPPSPKSCFFMFLLLFFNSDGTGFLFLLFFICIIIFFIYLLFFCFVLLLFFSLSAPVNFPSVCSGNPSSPDPRSDYESHQKNAMYSRLFRRIPFFIRPALAHSALRLMAHIYIN